MIGLSLGLTLGRQSSQPEPAAPSGLAVSIAEASLEFGDTATASVSVSGYPSPTLAYQWTLDAVDVDGQTNATFEGVPVGALRVRATATNSEGSAGPTTSDPVTVVALAPDAFSAGQWTLDANGVSGQLAVTLIGLPPSNGAAISSVERQVDAGTWTALAGITLDTAYTITGLTDDVLYSVKLRAVNSIGNSPESDTKTDTPFAPAVPETVGDNGWTFQPVESSTDLEVFIAQTPDWTGFSLNVDAEGADTATYTALESGPVALAVPTISGTPALGATMTAGTGRWASLTGVTSYAYQWESDGTPIGGATSATYDLVEADASTDLTVVVTATDTAGSTASESAATAIPAFFPDLFSTTTGTLKNTLEDDPHNAGWTLNSNMSRTALTPVGTSVGPTRVAVTASPVFAKGIFISIGNLETSVPVRVACIVQPASGGKCYLLLETSGGSTIAGFYTTNFTSVTTTGSGATGAAVTDVGGGYYRMEMTYTPGSTQAAQIKIGPAGGTVGDAVDVYLGGVANVS